MAMTSTIVLSTFFIGGLGLALLIGAIFLQIFLSKKANKWLGLILPIICVVFSLIAVLSVPMYTSGTLSVQEIKPDGTVVEKIVEQEEKSVIDTGSSALHIVIIFVIYNIPTAILMLIYFTCRQKSKKNREIDKMIIQDLE